MKIAAIDGIVWFSKKIECSIVIKDSSGYSQSVDLSRIAIDGEKSHAPRLDFQKSNFAHTHTNIIEISSIDVCISESSESMMKYAWKKKLVFVYRVWLHKQQSHSVVEKPTPQIQILFYVHSGNGINCVPATGVATFFELAAPLAEWSRECRLQLAISIECSTYISEIDTEIAVWVLWHAREEHHHRHHSHHLLGYHRYRLVYSQCHSIFHHPHSSWFFFYFAATFSVLLLPWFLMCGVWLCMSMSERFVYIVIWRN